MKSFFVTIVFITTAAFAQVRESVTVQVVDVPVHVTSNGQPVTGLTRENFQLFVNGKPQKIDYFDALDFATLPPEQARDPRQRRLYTLVFDLTSSPNELRRAQHAAMELLDQAAVNHTFAVASIGYGPLKMVVPFTRDRLALRRSTSPSSACETETIMHLSQPIRDAKLRALYAAEGFQATRRSRTLLRGAPNRQHFLAEQQFGGRR